MNNNSEKHEHRTVHNNDDDDEMKWKKENDQQITAQIDLNATLHREKLCTNKAEMIMTREICAREYRY